MTIQKILEREILAIRYDRCQAFEKRHTEQPNEMTLEQIALNEKQKPQLKKRYGESGKLGELLNQDTFLFGYFKGVGRVYIHVVADTSCSYAFGFMQVSKQVEAAVAVLYKNVFPYYQKHKLSEENILTDNDTEICGIQQHPYELDTETNDIKHYRSNVRVPQTNDFVE